MFTAELTRKVALVTGGASFIGAAITRRLVGADLAVDGGYGAMGPEALGQAFEKFPITEATD